MHFDRGQRLWPNSASVRYHAGLAAEYDGDLERAVEEYRQAVRIDAAATSGAWRLARILEGQGQREAAQIALAANSQKLVVSAAASVEIDSVLEASACPVPKRVAIR